jgi:hypothetical protein
MAGPSQFPGAMTDTHIKVEPMVCHFLAVETSIDAMYIQAVKSSGKIIIKVIIYTLNPEH